MFADSLFSSILHNVNLCFQQKFVIFAADKLEARRLAVLKCAARRRTSYSKIGEYIEVFDSRSEMKEQIRQLAERHRLAKTKQEKEAVAKEMEMLKNKDPKSFTEALESLIHATAKEVDDLSSFLP